MKSFLSSIRQIDLTDNTLISHQNSKSIDLHTAKAVPMWQKWQKGFNALLLFSSIWGGTVLDAPAAQAATTPLFFDQTPTLVSGTALTQGAVYRYPSVASGIDAMVEIQTIQNAQLKNLDDNSIFPARFQPVIAPTAAALTNATSYVKFNFKLIPSSTPSNTSFAVAPTAIATNAYFSAQDIDGNGGTDTIREFIEVIGALTTYLASPTLLQTATPIFGGAGYEAADSLNLQNGIGTDNRYEIYSYLGESVSTFSIVGGNKTGSSGCTLDATGCDRQNSWTFDVSEIQKLDFGDAPSIFGNAFHSVPLSPTVMLGSSVDGDDGPSYTSAANGDGADDDGVASFPALTSASTNYSLNLTCAGDGAFVAGWIDFNKNNTFDAGERAAGTCSGGNATLNWSGLSGLTTGNSYYARFRISSTASEVINPTGQAFDGEVEDYKIEYSAPFVISGTVFEDVNYGGGAGRSLTGSSGVKLGGATVELYDSTGTLRQTTTTSTVAATLGQYNFGVNSGNYTVRVVNSTVPSSRTGYNSTLQLQPVQTFRTNTGTAGTVTGLTDRVGGEKPDEVDAPAGTIDTTTLITLNAGTTEAQSVTAVTVGTVDVTGIDFGYNFDTIVNTNDSGQGSLRQFILNSNALANTGLAQANLTAGQEASIFMIPGQAATALGVATTAGTAGIRAGVANQLTNGVAIIKPTTPLPQVIGANTSIDGSTQTTNVGETNPGGFGYAGLVGTGPDGVSGSGDEAPLLKAISKPEVEIQGISGNVLDIKGANAIVRGLAILGNTGNPTGILIQSGANNFLVENSMIGFSATIFDDPGASNRLANGIYAYGTDNIIVRNNLVGHIGSFGVISSSSNTLVERNRFAPVGLVSLLSSRSEQMRYSGNGPATIKDNYFDSTKVGQIDLGSGQNVLVDNNTLENGHSLNSNDSSENAAIHARSGATNITISHNIIRNTQNNAHGVMVHGNGYETDFSAVAASRIKITQNSIFNSGKLGINLNPSGHPWTSTNDGVTPNDGLRNAKSGNNDMDYPFITSSKLNGSTLTLKGYVGTNNPVGRTAFGAATIEFFVGEISTNNTNDLGPVFSTDPTTVSKLHAEGKTYLGTCTADANGRFGTVANPCVITVPAGTDPINITSTATDTAGNTSEFSAALGNDPQLVLVKRVTKIGSTAITTTIDDTRSTAKAANDNNLKWPLPNTSNGVSPILVGSIDTAKAAPGQEIEYTIYFLSAGNAPIKDMNICDLVPANTTYVTGSGQISFNGAAANALSSEYLPAGAVANTPGIGLCKTPRNPALNSLTAAENPRGLVWVKIDNYQTPLAPFDYGYIRFRALVNLTNP